MNNHLSFFKYLGVPYKHKGRDFSGLDCWGLPIIVYKDFLGVDLLDLDNYSQDWSKEGANYFLDNYSKQFEQIFDPNSIKTLDILLFKDSKKQHVNHAGIALDIKSFIHCPYQGVVISRINDKFWGERLEGVFRLKR